MMPQRSPSEILSSLSSALPAETFVQLLRKHLYPALDCLSDVERLNISGLLEPIEHANLELAKRIALIDYNGMNAKLSDQVTALYKHAKREWRDGYEFQFEMMEEIAELISDWLPVLWTVGVEDGVEIPLVHKCLQLCYRTVNRVYDCDSRAEFSDIDGAVKIADKSGKVIYSARGGYFQAISWLWRDLLISSLAISTDNTQANAIIDDISEIDFINDVAGQLRGGSDAETSEVASFNDEHWTENMKIAAGRLKVLFVNRRISAFQTNPTFLVYHTLVKASPELQEPLVETAREYFFGHNRHNILWGHAFRIFKHAEKNDDILRVLDKINEGISTPKTEKVKREIVLHLIGQSDELRVRALTELHAGLSDALSTLWSEVEFVFPSIEEAYDFLDEQIEDKKIPKRVPHSDSFPNFDRKRERILEKFVAIARRGADRDSDGEDYDHERRMDGLDENDSDYEDILGYVSPDISGSIEEWLSILDKWPNEAEAKKAREDLEEKEHPLYDIDGVADALIYRCDTSARIHIASGIRAAYFAFGPDGPIKDKMNMYSKRIAYHTITL